ncbi:MAG: FAD-dependent monooxygenase [Hyphomicrobium sp.]
MTAARHATQAAETDAMAARRGPPRLVLIAGAGIGGLATALALARLGIASHVLERRPQFSEEGAGIQIGPNGSKILARLGVADAVASEVALPGEIRVHDGIAGRTLASMPLNPWIEAGTARPTGRCIGRTCTRRCWRGRAPRP